MVAPVSSLPDHLAGPDSGAAGSLVSGVASNLPRLGEERVDATDGVDGRARSTKRAYAADFSNFAHWCAAVGSPALPASENAVCHYITAMVSDANGAGYSVATIERRLAAIAYVHEVNGFGVPPTRHARVRELMANVRQTHGRVQDKRDALTTAQLGAMIGALDLSILAGKRDSALLLAGYAGAFRRAELAGLAVSQITRSGGDYVVALRGTGDNRSAEGRIVSIPAFTGSSLCPVAALDAWLDGAAITEGPLFRKVTRYQTISAAALSPASVALIVKRCALAAGIPSQRLASHSLRAGHATTAAANGAPDRVIMAQTGHRSTGALDDYTSPGGPLRDSSARYLDLEMS